MSCIKLHWVNQFDVKDACIEFAINKGKNNVKTKLNLKVKKIC